MCGTDSAAQQKQFSEDGEIKGQNPVGVRLSLSSPLNQMFFIRNHLALKVMFLLGSCYDDDSSSRWTDKQHFSIFCSHLFTLELTAPQDALSECNISG